MDQSNEQVLQSTWRTGRTLGRTLYKDGICVGIVDTPELAAELVARSALASARYEVQRPTGDRPTCDTPGCGRPIPEGGEGCPETCPTCLACLHLHGEKADKVRTPIRIRLVCPACGELHVDEGEFATKPHHTHACQHCGAVWRPALVPTVGVRFLPELISQRQAST
jgi:hypothetical protein